MVMEVPVQFFQTVIAIELGVAGALLFEIRFFDAPDAARQPETRRADPRVLLLFSVVLSATLFGSLWAIVHRAGTTAASAVTVGVAVSLLPILSGCCRLWSETRGRGSAIRTTHIPSSCCWSTSRSSPARSCY